MTDDYLLKVINDLINLSLDSEMSVCCRLSFDKTSLDF